MTNVATIDLLDALGLDRGVIVHCDAHGSDNRASLDGIATAPHRLREVGIVDYVGFQVLLKLMQETDHVWAKISSSYRLLDQGQPYRQMTLLAWALIETRAEGVVWGTNWPHPMLWGHPMPNDADLFDQFMDWDSDDATRWEALVTNPETLYGFIP